MLHAAEDGPATTSSPEAGSKTSTLPGRSCNPPTEIFPVEARFPVTVKSAPGLREPPQVTSLLRSPPNPIIGEAGGPISSLTGSGFGDSAFTGSGLGGSAFGGSTWTMCGFVETISGRTGGFETGGGTTSVRTSFGLVDTGGDGTGSGVAVKG